MADGSDQPGLSTAVLDQLERRLWRSLLATALFYLSLGVALLMALVEDPPRSPRSHVIASLSLTALAIIAVLAPAGVLASRRRFRRAVAWARAGRSPTARDRERMRRLPFEQSMIVLTTGLGAAFVLFSVCAVYYPWSLVGRLLAGAAVTVFGAWLLGYLVAEQVLGPVLGHALGTTNADARFGVVGRLGAAWMQGAAVPLACLIIAPDRLGLDALQWTVLSIGLAFSFTAIVTTARSIARPLRALRRDVQRVRQGDFSVTVATDDGGEIGQLQVAVNEMLAGLRQRERLHQLFGKHVGEEVARRALEGDDALGGDLRDVSAVFVDVVGSTALAESVPPDELVVILNAFYGAIVSVVDAERGFVNKFEGDAALCIFGAPSQQPDHARRALLAARSLRAVLDDLAPHFHGLDVGIGVSTGSVVAGNVGTHSRYEYTVIGAAVNEAARLSELAKTHKARVLASAETVQRAGEEANAWREDDVVQLRGKSVPIAVFAPKALQLPRVRGTGASRLVN